MNPKDLIDEKGNETTLSPGDRIFVSKGERGRLSYAVMREMRLLRNSLGQMFFASLMGNERFDNLPQVFGHGVLCRYMLASDPVEQYIRLNGQGGWKAFRILP